MQDKDLTALLSDDLEEAAKAYDNDSFTRTLLSQLDSRQRARTGVLGVAGMIGAGLAASQFNELFDFAANASMAGSASPAASYYSPMLMASLVIAAAAVATALVIRRES